MKRFLLATAALVAAVVVFTVVELPPKAVALDSSWRDATIPGVLHIHTNRSDGLSTPDEVAAAAAKAGLKFLVFTDHGDATREPDPPTYRAGVLCLDGVEISTSGGHYVAIGMGASPYPLAGESRDVVEDVHRLGGFGIAAHPDSPKPELRWTDWNAPIDGLELINPDTSWRVHMLQGGARAKFRLLSALFTYPVRAGETIGSLLTDSTDLDDRWNLLLAQGPVVGIAGVDAHAKLTLIDSDPGKSDPGNSRYSLPVPGYEASFRVLSVHVRLAAPFSGAANADAAALASAIRKGELYTAVDAWATPPEFDFTATNRNGNVGQGNTLSVGGPVSLQVHSNAPTGFVATVWRNGEALTQHSDHEFSLTADEAPAVYRVTIRDPGRPSAPAWLIGNPIYVRGPERMPQPAPSPAAAVTRVPLFDGRSTAGWTRESDAASLSAIEAAQMVSAMELRLRYGLRGGSAVGQYSGAAVETTHGVRDYDRVAFTIRAEHPMRVSIQVRAEVPNMPPERWQRSVYIDATDTDRAVAFSDMRPVGITHTDRAVPENVRAIMFIVDTTNSKPGASGRIWLKNVRLER